MKAYKIMIARKFIRLERKSCRYLESGQGNLIIFLASQLIQIDTYKNTIEALASRYHVIALDLPGSGKSSRLKRPWGTERFKFQPY
jgi:pimeloyl-ACP methyl ester carboxylesterase